jgi:predicted nucleic acid-binding protein
MIMVDSSVWIDYFNGKECPEVAYLDAILGIKPVVIGDNILTEQYLFSYQHLCV